METLTLWVKNMVFYIVFLTLIFHLLPSGRYEKYVRLFAGMVFILVAVQPFTSSLRLEEKTAAYFEQFSFQDEAADFRGELNEMEKRRLGELTGEYEQKVAGRVKEIVGEEGVEAPDVEVEIDSDSASETFGRVVRIRVTEGKNKPKVGENLKQENGAEGDGAQIGGGGQPPIQEDRVQSKSGGLPAQRKEVQLGKGEEPPVQENGARPGKSGWGGSFSVEPVEPVEPVEIGQAEGRREVEEPPAQDAAVSGDRVSVSDEDPAGARLRSRLAEYYDLEESHVEIQLEHD